MLDRFQDWVTRLDLFLVACQHRRFEYGRFDCCLFVADAIQVMTGVDPAQRFRANYTSRKEAFRAIQTYTGQRSLAAVADRVFAEYSLPEAPILAAQRGDVVLVKRSGDYSLAILSLNGRDILALASKGLLRLPITAACRSWRV